jgi:transcriptional regulator with XRE-family HTH domain
MPAGTATRAKPKSARKSAEIVTLAMPRRIEVAALDKIDTSTMGGRIEWARLRKGLRQEDLANRLSKSRITVGAYESNQITPPITVVEEVARVLGTSPSYLAYGEHTVPVYGKAEIDVVAGPEYRIGKDGAFPVSGFALSRDLVDSYGVEPEQLAAYVLNHDAKEFDLHAGDRLFVNKAIIQPSNRHELYLLQTESGIEVVRVEPNLSSKAATSINMTGPKGQSFSAKAGDLKFIGAIVATLRRQ